MPIKIADSLPARAVLESENIFVMTEHRAATQDIRPLRIGLLNLMPLKIITETQILRCLSNTPIQIEVDLIQTETYHSKNTPEDHLLTFYKTFDDIRDQKYDGFIITGAPVETMPFEEVEYWKELTEIMDWTKNARSFHAAHLLGCAGRSVLSLRYSEVHAARENVRYFQAPCSAAEGAAAARLR